MDSSSSRHFVELTCSLCTGLSVKFNTGDYIKHLRLFHAHRPDFKVTCGIDGCLRNYTNLGSFKNHISFMHNTDSERHTNEIFTNDTSAEFGGEDESFISDEDFISSNDTSDLNEDNQIPVTHDEINPDTNNILTLTAKDLQKSSAYFLLGMKEKYKLTQVAIQGIVEGTTSITQQCITALKSKV